jgi:oxygen-independent coproporphyrinogen-3 oxidase
LSKCPYCDFNVHIRPQVDQARWRDAYGRALEHYAALVPDRKIVSVFFGGGTPSLMEPETIRFVLDRIRALWPCASGMEITLEANPTSVETNKLQAFAQAGINRISLGVQALSDKDLAFLGRKHSAAQALEAFAVAKQCVKRVSFDLIYARPGQSLEDWEKELYQALDHKPEHLSLYQLTIERNTPFYFDREQGKFSLPDEDVAADFYHLTQDILEGAGLPAYEVSNHAVPGQESRHNLLYWHYGEYIGIGPGAHGRLALEDGRKYAIRDHHAPDIWLERVEKTGAGAHEPTYLPPRERFSEALMMGLRLREGLAVSRLEEEGACALGDALDLERAALLEDQSWLFRENGMLRLSREGMLRLNAIVPYLLKAAPEEAQDSEPSRPRSRSLSVV